MRIQSLLDVDRIPGREVQNISVVRTLALRPRLRTCFTFGLLAVATLLVDVSAAGAQEALSVPDGAQPQLIRSRSVAPKVTTRPSPSQPPSKPSSSSSKSKTDPKKGDSKDGKKDEGAKNPDVVTRPTEPETPPNPDELTATPNAAGMLRLNFQGQPWPDVIRWLKKVSGKSLDWQELPGGFLNLTTHREYTVDEARNMINRHLLARGYTILIRDELMTVEKIEKLNPAMVQRVSPEALDQRDDYEFVKVSFTLTALVAAQAAEELKPMLSPNGKLVPLAKTNRLEAIDSVINLREIRDILTEEQSGDGNERRVWQFELEHVRAEDIIEPLYSLLGVQQAAAGPMSSSQMQQFQKMIQAAAKGKSGAQEEQKLQIVAVPRENVLLVTGPADKIATIADAVELLDQPSLRSQSILDSIQRTEVYRLENFDPAAFIETVRELGGLSPLTQIRADETRGAVIVSGSKVDHLILSQLLEKIDGTSREFHVIPLRKLDAEYVAGSIKLMMGAEEKKQDSRRSYYYNPYSSRSSSSQSQDFGDKFTIDADVEYNRLLMRCTTFELEQVQDLLIKLGELPRPGGNPSRRRVFETGNLEDSMLLIERLQKVWPSRGANELKLIPPVLEPEKDTIVPQGPNSPDVLEPRKPAREADGKKSVDDKPVKTAEWSPRSSSNPFLSGSQPLFRAASQSQAVEADDKDDAASSELAAPEAPGTPKIDKEVADEALRNLVERIRAKQQEGALRSAPSAGKADGPASSSPPPIQIRIGTNGEIYIESDDPAALDLLEEVLDEYAPPKRDWKVIKLKYPQTWAYGIEVILKDIFKEEIDASESKDSGSRSSPFGGYYPGGSSNNSGPRRLSARKPLKIISDRDSHTILVQGASDEQLRMIEELIEIYDKPQSTETRSIRKTQIFKIQYSKAKVIAAALKEVYRDLLSENDKALQEGKGNKKEDRPSERGYTYIYGSGGDEGEDQEEPIKFKGLLSIGVDETANILIISATEGLLNNVSEIIDQLDMAAQPNSSYKVVPVNSRVNLRELQKKLHNMLAPKPPQQQKNQNGKGQPQNGNNNQNAVQNGR
ncbi:MAG: secretin N-terminal domain-containing protein [Planctomycetales bacterium]|jgi:type II secretory pathway component GspD/PulD (secretin)